MQQIIDYRNAKYQGSLNENRQREGLGILVDDDLTFYVSEWNKGALSGNTVVYLSHGKYIYGSWQDNQPHGLNVFRIGDAVMLAYLENGEIEGRVLVIFQRFNFIAVLEYIKKEVVDVVSSGELFTHQDLLKYVALLKVKIPEHYFSLVKFICSFVSTSIKVAPSKSGTCFFGYDNLGLAIIFNANNGIVSVGMHQDGKLSEFGAKYDTIGNVQQGNFETKQTIKYQKDRPKYEIYSIFQKMHKRSLYFENSYFHSKNKTLSIVEELLRGKIAQIANSSRNNKITTADLNDSLDYHALNQQQSEQIIIQRKNVYETPKSSTSGFKKVGSKNDENSHKKNSKITKKIIPFQKSVQTQKNLSPIFVKKFQPKILTQESAKSKSKSKIKGKINTKIEQNYTNQENYLKFQEDSFRAKKNIKKSQQIVNPSPTRELKQLNYIPPKNYPILNSPSNVSVKNYKERTLENSMGNSLKQSPYRINSKYQDLNERRKRIINQYKNLREPEITTKQDLQSPCMRQKLLSYTSKNQQQSSGCLPLSITKLNQNKKNLDLNFDNSVSLLQKTAVFNEQCQGKQQSYLSPFKKKDSNIISQTNRKTVQPQHEKVSNTRTPTRKQYKYYFD